MSARTSRIRAARCSIWSADLGSGGGASLDHRRSTGRRPGRLVVCPFVASENEARRSRRKRRRSEIDPEQMALLGESLLFESLDEVGRESLASKGIVHTFRAGEMIIREGDLGDSLYVVCSGTVRVTTQRHGVVVDLGTLARPACFGEASALSGQTRAETVEALEETRVVSFSRDFLETIVHRFPEFRKRIDALILGRAKAAVHAIERNRP